MQITKKAIYGTMALLITSSVVAGARHESVIINETIQGKASALPSQLEASFTINAQDKTGALASQRLKKAYRLFESEAEKANVSCKKQGVGVSPRYVYNSERKKNEVQGYAARGGFSCRFESMSIEAYNTLHDEMPQENIEYHWQAPRWVLSEDDEKALYKEARKDAVEQALLTQSHYQELLGGPCTLKSISFDPQGSGVTPMRAMSMDAMHSRSEARMELEAPTQEPIHVERSGTVEIDCTAKWVPDEDRASLVRQ